MSAYRSPSLDDDVHAFLVADSISGVLSHRGALAHFADPKRLGSLKKYVQLDVARNRETLVRYSKVRNSCRSALRPLSQE